MKIRNLFVATLALSHYATNARVDDRFKRLRGLGASSADLPACTGLKETQFYNIGKSHYELRPVIVRRLSC